MVLLDVCAIVIISRDRLVPRLVQPTIIVMVGLSVSLCNVSECERLGIGGKGSKLQVIKANKIIPKVINVTEPMGIFEIPTECPVCHAEATVKESESGTKTLHCSNPHCAAKQIKKFARFVSKEGLNIEGISEQTIWRLVNEGLISEYADFYHLNDHAYEIATWDGFGKKSEGYYSVSKAKRNRLELTEKKIVDHCFLLS